MALKCFNLVNPNPTTMAKLPSTTPPIPRFTSLPVTPRSSFLQLAYPQGKFEQGGKSENEAWKLVLASSIEKTINLYRISKEALEIYWTKTMPVLKKAAKDFKIEAAKASYDLSIIAQQLGEEARHYIENAPEPLKEVVETFKSYEKTQIHDFYIGVPYGGILAVGGFLDFMVTGRTAAVRFGVILGGTLLALSVSSLRLWRKGEVVDGVVLKCETAIAGILFLRQFRLLFQVPGVVAAFFIYRILDAIEPQK